MNEEQDLKQLQNEVKKLAKTVNQRILRIERTIKADTLAVENLRNRLDTEYVKGMTKSGRVRFNKSLSYWQLQGIKKASEEFLNKDVSTIKGLRKQLEEYRKENDLGEEFDYQDLFNYMKTEIDLYAWITRYIPPSQFDNIVEYAKEHNYTKTKFVDTILTVGKNVPNDLDSQERIKQLYNKYVK